MVKSADDSREKSLRQAVLDAAEAYNALVHAPKPFVPGESPVPVSGKCWGAEEMRNLVDASLDFWLTAGRYNDRFEHAFAACLGRKHALTVNSGSSANLVAIASLCSPKLGERGLKPGDEVITVAAGFPTTVAPIVQHGLVPVFVDITPPTYNAAPERIAEAISPKTRAIFMAHTLGNPFDLQGVLALAKNRDLWLVEDSCDALGSTYALNGQNPRKCGGFGHFATFSFYPAHHITMGEGGAVVCDDPELYRIALSVRDWGRDCWCPPGHDDTCKRRYKWNFPLLPEGYDHKYVYSHLGYNLKITDMQAAVGLAQLERLPEFTATRRRNFNILYEALRPLDGGALILPQATAGAEPSWFGFPITLNPRFERRALLERLNAAKIGTRLLFAGNITRQPCFEGVPHRVVGELKGTDQIMRHCFWVGVYPGLTLPQIDYIGKQIIEYLVG
jgi:CDP-6-deoxy-D-xylo-4-hexulose-3-dehydrase